MKDWTLHDLGVMEGGGEINSKGIYNFNSKSDIGGRVVTWETTWSGVWFLQL